MDWRVVYHEVWYAINGENASDCNIFSRIEKFFDDIVFGDIVYADSVKGDYDNGDFVIAKRLL